MRRARRLLALLMCLCLLGVATPEAVWAEEPAASEGDAAVDSVQAAHRRRTRRIPRTERRPETAQMRRRPERSPRRAPGNSKKRVRKPRRSCRARQSCRTLCAAMPACSGAQPAI